MIENTMSFVATEHVDNAYKDFYKNNDIGKYLDKKAYNPFKSNGEGSKLIEGLAYEGAMTTVALIKKSF